MPSPSPTVRPAGRRAQLVLAGMLSLIGTASAQISSTINVSGLVTDTTCEVNPTTRDQTVTLPTIKASLLKAVGDVAGATAFQIELINCPEPMNGKDALVTFSSNANIDTQTSNLRAYLVQRNAAPQVEHGTVQIELTDAADKKIQLAAASGSQNVPTVTITANRATMSFFARYVKTAEGAVAAGRITTSVNFDIIYP